MLASVHPITWHEMSDQPSSCLDMALYNMVTAWILCEPRRNFLQSSEIYSVALVNNVHTFNVERLLPSLFAFQLRNLRATLYYFSFCRFCRFCKIKTKQYSYKCMNNWRLSYACSVEAIVCIQVKAVLYVCYCGCQYTVHAAGGHPMHTA